MIMNKYKIKTRKSITKNPKGLQGKNNNKNNNKCQFFLETKERNKIHTNTEE